MLIAAVAMLVPASSVVFAFSWKYLKQNGDENCWIELCAADCEFEYLPSGREGCIYQVPTDHLSRSSLNSYTESMMRPPPRTIRLVPPDPQNSIFESRLSNDDRLITMR